MESHSEISGFNQIETIHFNINEDGTVLEKENYGN